MPILFALGSNRSCMILGLPFTRAISTGTVSSKFPQNALPHGLDSQNGAEVSSRMNKQVMNMRGFLSLLTCTAELMFPMISG